MAVIAGERKAIPSANPTRSPTVTVGPQNVGLPGYRPGDPGVGYGPTTGWVPPPAAPAPAAPAPPPPPPPPPPPDYWALAETDPRYIQGKGLLDRRNQMDTTSLNNAWAQQGQSSQDSFNAHGGLFSGAAINAQRGINQQHTDAAARQQLGYDQNLHDLRWQTFNSLINQIANPSGQVQ